MASEARLLWTELACGDGAGPRPLRAVLRVPGGHPILAGHFPGAPLVPGVLLLEAVRQACERTLARTFRLVEVVEARFSQPVAPDQPVSLQAALTGDGPDVEVEGAWHGEGGRIATFRLRLGPGDA